MFIEYGELSTMLYEHTKPIGCSIVGDIEYYTEKWRCRTMILFELFLWNAFWHSKGRQLVQ